jgi:hypothetical protein
MMLRRCLLMLRRWLYYLLAWLRNLFSIKALSALLSSFGALWLAVEIATFFFPDTIIFGHTKVPDAIRNAWLWFALAGVAMALYLCRPRLSVSCRLKARDVAIKIAVGDIFSFPGALIVGSNTTFDTQISRKLISADSVQGVFTRRYYGDETQLESELASSLNNVPFDALHGTRIGKSKRYPIGHCIRVNPQQRTGYFLAIADINEHGVASSSFENLKKSLAELWVFIGNRGMKEPLVMPVLGTGAGRLRETREEIIREIINSFIAACSERTFTDGLTIVIHPGDLLRYDISLDDLKEFLQHQCRYTVFSTGNRPPVGTPA